METWTRWPALKNDSVTTYQYAPNPISWIDPWGLSPCAPNESFKRLNSDKVYRVIRPDENPDIGLFEKNPANIKTAAGHVTSGSRSGSQFISATKDIEIAQKLAQGTGNKIIEIDLSKVPSNGYFLPERFGFAREWLGQKVGQRILRSVI